MQGLDDRQLLRDFVGRGSDEAFAALVKRHASLVYGTARRKLDNSADADEVTQAVFVALSKKAPYLCHRANLSGWLHQTALLECRAYLRTEIRRRRREETAMELNELRPNHDPSLAAEIDDALMELSEKDRQPLLLRFFENLSLREVGKALSIHEDAAQKRVSKGLTVLERVLKRRGKDIGGAAALAALLAGSAETAPAQVVLAATQAGLAVTTTSFALGAAFAKFMALTKTQTAVICLLAVSTPLLIQTQRLQAARLEQSGLQASLDAAGRAGASRTEWLNRFRKDLRGLQDERTSAALKAALVPQKVAPAPNMAELYRWNPSADYVRLPKSILEGIKLSTEVRRMAADDPKKALNVDRTAPLDSQGGVTEALAEALGLTLEDQKRVFDAVSRIKSQYAWLAQQNTTVTNVMPPNINFSHKPGELLTLKISPFAEQGQELKKQLQAELESAVGGERGGILMEQGRNEFEQAFQNFGASEQWLAMSPPENGRVTVGNTWAYGSWVSTLPVEHLPEPLRPYYEQFTQKLKKP